MINLLYPDSLKDEGNYNQAIAAYHKTLLNNLSLREKADVNQKIVAAKGFYISVANISVGEVFFPVINEANSRGIVLTGKVSLDEDNKLSDELTGRWQKIKKITANFLDKYLFENIKTVMVLDWGIEQYNYSIKTFPNSKIDLDELVGGESVELAMFISLVSFIINKNIGNTFAFTGKVNDNFSVGSVTRIQEKNNVIIAERPMVKKFIVPFGSKTNTKFQVGLNTLEKVVKIVFPNFNKILIKKQDDIGNRRITLNTYKTTAMDKKKHWVVKFTHQDLQNSEASKIHDFLKNNAEHYIKADGVIIDGLLITYAIPMLVSLREVTNHISDFIAVRYLRSIKNGFAEAFVIRTKNIGGSRFVGEHFEYKINPEYEHVKAIT